MKRFWCWLLGCVCANHAPICERCGYGVYSGEFVDRGWLRPLLNGMQDGWQMLKYRLRVRRCLHCGKRLPFWPAASYPEYCNEECFTKWLPF